MKHTPGPWRVWEQNERLCVESNPSELGDFNLLVCQVTSAPLAELSEPDRHTADAQLIAAAPDLLAALQLAASSDDLDAVQQVAREAIQRAVG